jgi:hypothetical protein
VKNIKKRRLFFYIVREENIRPQVLSDNISPPFFQHYGKKISYRILSYYLQLKHWLSSQNDQKKSIIDLVLHCICMTVVPCTKVLKDFSSVWSYKIFEHYQHLPKMVLDSKTQCILLIQLFIMPFILQYIANSSWHWGSYGSIWIGPSPKQYYMDRSYMAVYGPVRHQKNIIWTEASEVYIIFFWWRIGPCTAIWPEVTWTICYIILFI